MAAAVIKVPKALGSEPDGVQVILTEYQGVAANQIFTEEELEARILSLQQYYMSVKPELFEGKEDWKPS